MLNIDHVGATWPNLGPRCAPDSLTLLKLRETVKTETVTTEKTETETTETETDRDRERERRERGERERDGVAGHVQDGSPDFGVYEVYARAVSPLLEKDATGTPEVPVPVLHREGLCGPPPTEDVDGAHLARTNSRTLHSARIVHSFTVSCSLAAFAALADRSFFCCCGWLLS